MDVLLTLAILRKIAFASSVLPFTINHRTDSGVRLNKQKEMFSSVLVQSLFSKDIKSPSLVDRDVSVVITLIIISLNGRFLLSRYLVSSRIAPSPSPNGCFNHCFIPFPLLWMRGTATHSKPECCNNHSLPFRGGSALRDETKQRILRGLIKWWNRNFWSSTTKICEVWPIKYSMIFQMYYRFPVETSAERTWRLYDV